VLSFVAKFVVRQMEVAPQKLCVHIHNF